MCCYISVITHNLCALVVFQKSQIIVPASTERKVETLLANYSQKATTIPKRRIADWGHTKINASTMPIRSSKELALLNKFGKDAHDFELQQYQAAQKVPLLKTIHFVQLCHVNITFLD